MPTVIFTAEKKHFTVCESIADPENRINNTHSFIFLCDATEIGKATLTSDEYDVAWIHSFDVDETYASIQVHDLPLPMFLMKIILNTHAKRTQTFRFITPTSKQLCPMLQTAGFTDFTEKNIMLRACETKSVYQPKKIDKLIITNGITENEIETALKMLNQNAYWASDLQAPHFKCLVKNAVCFVAVLENQVVGFARVFTDHRQFASFWDVVVASAHQRKGIGQQLIHAALHDAAFEFIPYWYLYTDKETAPFYLPFGFQFIENTAQAKIGQQWIPPCSDIPIKSALDFDPNFFSDPVFVTVIKPGIDSITAGGHQTFMTPARHAIAAHAAVMAPSLQPLQRSL